ncbi:MAG: polymerase, partial [Spirochaetes bacterium]|nr:polymerase [Spirochaetota bacterium]
MYRVIVLLLIIFTVSGAFADSKMDITGILEWDTMQIMATVSLDLVSAGIKLPAGRLQGEALLSEGCLRLIQPGILGLQVDSSSTIADL